MDNKDGKFFVQQIREHYLILSPQESDESLMEELHEAYKQWLPLCREENNSKEVFFTIPLQIIT